MRQFEKGANAKMINKVCLAPFLAPFFHFLFTFSKSFENPMLSLSMSRSTRKSLWNWSTNFGIWRIVAHIAFKFCSVASGTFSTGSTFWMSGGPTRGTHFRFGRPESAPPDKLNCAV